MKKIKIILISLVFILVAVSFIGFNQVNAEDTLIAHMGASPPRWFPITSTQREADALFELAYDTLVSLDEQGNPIPRMAESWEISDDGTEYTFNLKEGVKFHDGEEFTASDVKFSITLMTTPDIGSWHTSKFMNVEGARDYYDGESDEISGIEVVDDYTLKINLYELDTAFIFELNEPILPEHLFENMSYEEISDSTEADLLIGTGPYKLVEYERDDYFEFTKHEDYFLGEPNIDNVIIRIAEIDAALSMIQTGDIDYMFELPPREADMLEGLDNLSILNEPNDPWPAMLMFNFDKPYFNKEVRKAFAYGVDAQAYVEAILEGYGDSDPILFRTADWAIPEDYPMYEYDPERAAELLEEGDWDFDREVVVVDYPGNDPRSQFGEVLQEYMRELGVNIVLETVDVGRWVELTQPGDTDTRDFDIGLAGSAQGVHPAAMEIQVMSDGDNNRMNYSNERVDELFKLGRRAESLEEASDYYKEWNKILVDELAWLVFARQDFLSVINNRVNNFQYNPNIFRYNDPSRFLEIHEWEIE